MHSYPWLLKMQYTVKSLALCNGEFLYKLHINYTYCYTELVLCSKNYHAFFFKHFGPYLHQRKYGKIQKVCPLNSSLKVVLSKCLLSQLRFIHLCTVVCLLYRSDYPDDWSSSHLNLLQFIHQDHSDFHHHLIQDNTYRRCSYSGQSCREGHSFNQQQGACCHRAQGNQPVSPRPRGLPQWFYFPVQDEVYPLPT